MRHGVVAFAFLASSVLAPDTGADARRGETLYRQNCAVCHSTLQGDPIGRGAGRPDVIANAIRTNPAMSAFQGLLTPIDVTDIADFLAERFDTAPPPPPPPPPSPPPPPPTAVLTAVEFHHADLDHYFVSAIPAEIAALDAGVAIRGWARTGESFPVWPTLPANTPGATPVCRFYLPPAFGDSHFYSASPDECDAVRNRFPQFEFEASQVMAVLLPDAATGACPGDGVPVYRLWNQRADTNHRYTTKPSLRAAMIDAGHLPEGYGPLGVAFCVL